MTERDRLLQLRDQCEALHGHFSRSRYPKLSDSQCLTANRLLAQALTRTPSALPGTQAYMAICGGIVSCLVRGLYGNKAFGYKLHGYLGMHARRRYAALRATPTARPASDNS